MMAPKMRVIGIVFGLLVLTASGVWYSIERPAQAQAAAAKDSKLKVLLKEKLSILKEIELQATSSFKANATSLFRVREATLAVRNAELALCDTDQERVAVPEKMLAEASDHAKRISREKTSGEVPAKAVFDARMGHLDAEIALERVKSK